MEEKKNLPIQILKISAKVITTLLVMFTVFIMVFTIISVRNFDRNDRSIFGYKFYIVRTDSMSPSEKNAHLDVHFSAGDLIIVKEVKEPDKLEPGDIITFISMNQDDSWGQTITHMIRERYYDEYGRFVGYVTFGTNKDSNDSSPVAFGEVVGQYVGKIPSAGKFFAYVKTTPGYICCILIPFLLLILVNGVDVIRLFRKYKKEQTDAINAEKEEIAAERARNEDMLRELLALKEQLANGGVAAAPKAETVDAEVEEVAEPAEVKVTEPKKKKAAEPEQKPAEPVEETAEPTEETENSDPVEAGPTPEEEEAARKKAEAARKRRETIARKKAEAEAEAARLAAEEEAARLAEEEAARKKAEAARKRKETIARKKAEAEAARLAAENNASDSTEATEDSSSDN